MSRPMRITKFISLLTYLFFICCISRAQDVKIPSEFIETPIPKYRSDEASALNWSRNEFSVKVRNGKLKIDKLKNVNNKLELPEGTLTAVDRGEWGGSLNFSKKDDRGNSVEIKSGNIKFIFKYQDKIYFLEGIAHLDYNGGALFELKVSDDKFTYNKIVDFEDAPGAFTVFKDMLLVVTHKNLFIINSDLKTEALFPNAFWRGLYPNSIAAIDENNVFLGIRSGIVQINLTSRSYRFFKFIGDKD